MPEIEFVEPDPGHGPDEDLVTGPRHAASAPRAFARRSVRIGASAILAVVAASVAIGVLDHRDSGRPVAAGTSVVAPSAVVAPGVVASTTVDSDAPPGAHPDTHRGSPTAGESVVLVLPPCPDVDACDVQLDPPAAVTAAVQKWLVGATDVAGTSVVVDGRTPTLRTRSITARDGGLSIRIRIAPAADAQRPSAKATSTGAAATLTVVALTRGLAVVVTISGPAGEVPGLATVRSLAADRRLVAVG